MKNMPSPLLDYCQLADSSQVSFIAILLYVETYKGMKCNAITDVNLMKGLTLKKCDVRL